MTEKTPSEELRDLTEAIREARDLEKQAKAFVDDNMPRYYALLNKVYGKGRVEFEIEGEKFGRVIAEKAKFRLDDFRTDHPEFDFLIEEKITYSLNEGEAKAYIAENPDAEAILQEYTDIVQEERWKTPVKVKD